MKAIRYFFYFLAMVACFVLVANLAYAHGNGKGRDNGKGHDKYDGGGSGGNGNGYGHNKGGNDPIDPNNPDNPNNPNSSTFNGVGYPEVNGCVTDWEKASLPQCSGLPYRPFNN